MLEQGILCLDMDGLDYKALHVFSQEKGEVSAYLRAVPLSLDTVKIGRVLTLKRRQGVGKRMMVFAEGEIMKRFAPERIVIDAQVTAVPFYLSCGYTVISEEFMEEGKAHRKMEKCFR